MRNTNNFDYIIVGGGLAGMLLAWELHKRDKHFLVFANNAPASSNVAAGTWNPVTFRKMIPTWRSQEMIDKMLEVYSEVERELGITLLSSLKVEKIITTEQEAIFWEKMALTDESKDFLEPKLTDIKIKGEIKKTGIVKQTGRLDLASYVKHSNTYFYNKGNLIYETFNTSGINILSSSIEHNSVIAKKVIFAEGTYAEQNRFFNWLPFKCVKGDILTIESKDLNVDKIRKKNIFILPLGKNTYKIGATYHWSDKTWEPSNKGKLELLEKLEKITDCSYRIIKHEAGIRPATHDRRPFIGSHPVHKNILIFNGLGSKGVFLGPLMAHEFCNFMDEKKPLHPEVSVDRCVKKYFVLTKD
jgi:glycine/D-amino acid oxidase-like deaminating enzyme